MFPLWLAAVRDASVLMGSREWDSFSKAVSDGAVLVLNPATYQYMLEHAVDEEQRQFIIKNSRTSEHIPEDRALAVFTRQVEIELPFPRGTS